MIATTERVPQHTAPQVNRRIREQTLRNIKSFSYETERIDERLKELDREWDIERVLQTQASMLVLASVVLGTTVSRKWYMLSAVVGGFLLQHVIQGWCPPVPILRRLGVRTQQEIEAERYALKALRGDFRDATESEAIVRATEI
jgi:hypothetical protein